MTWGEWRAYVPAAERRARARKALARRQKKGLNVEPVEVAGRSIVQTFWGRAWCGHLEKFSDFANRLPRGRTYVRNGSVCHLEITSGEILAIVSGSELYDVRVTIKKLPSARWRAVKAKCAGGIATVLELLEGRISAATMAIVTDRDQGIFPLPREITLECSCPDWATMCKHVAAVLYGAGVRLDLRPELLFLLRGIDHEELISAPPTAIGMASGQSTGGPRRKRLAPTDLTGVFDIDMLEAEGVAPRAAPAKPPRRGKPRGRATALEVPATPRTTLASRTPRFLTGIAVTRLRAGLDMTREQFAAVVGVSTTTIGNWEKTQGRLNLQARTRDALTRTAALSKADAWARLDVVRRVPGCTGPGT